MLLSIKSAISNSLLFPIQYEKRTIKYKDLDSTIKCSKDGYTWEPVRRTVQNH